MTAVKFLRFGLASALSFGLTVGLLTVLCEWAEWRKEVAYIASQVLVSTLNFLALRYLVFGNGNLGICAQAAYFFASIFLFRVMEAILFWVLVSALSVQYQIAAVVIALCSLLAKFVFYGRGLFKETPSDL